MRRGESHERILNAARAEFGEHGLTGARINRIADRAGVNKQLLYYYFGSKRQLFRAAAAPSVDETEQKLAGNTVGPEAVRRIMKDLFAELAARPELVSLLTDRNRAEQSLARRWVDAKVRAIAALVSQGQGTGHFRDDLDPDLLAKQAIVLCAGFHAVGYALSTEPDAWITSACDALLLTTAW